LKRAEALRSLSRDHHQALFVAQRLRRAEDPVEAAAAFLEFWRAHGAAHFRVEEDVLLPCWALLGTVDEPGAARLSAEHLRIRAAALAVESGHASLEALHELGEQLNDHVRFEERELFRLIEADLGDEELARLAAAVAAAEERG
jgi:hemerythrin-like domain-containing protein